MTNGRYLIGLFAKLFHVFYTLMEYRLFNAIENQSATKCLHLYKRHETETKIRYSFVLSSLPLPSLLSLSLSFSLSLTLSFFYLLFYKYLVGRRLNNVLKAPIRNVSPSFLLSISYLLSYFFLYLYVYPAITLKISELCYFSTLLRDICISNIFVKVDSRYLFWYLEFTKFLMIFPLGIVYELYEIG